VDSASRAVSMATSGRLMDAFTWDLLLVGDTCPGPGSVREGRQQDQREDHGRGDGHGGGSRSIRSAAKAAMAHDPAHHPR
jgi:hypothetical protein